MKYVVFNHVQLRMPAGLLPLIILCAMQFVVQGLYCGIFIYRCVFNGKLPADGPTIKTFHR